MVYHAYMASKRLIYEVLQRGLDSYRAELQDLDQRRKDLKETIARVEQELKLDHQGPRARRGKQVPYKPSDVKALTEKTASLNFTGKTAVEAARMIYWLVAQGGTKELHAGLVYQVLCARQVIVTAKRRAADVFASYLRRSQYFEKVGPNIFRLKELP